MTNKDIEKAAERSTEKYLENGDLRGFRGSYRLGFIAGADWRDMLSKGFKECFRVLKSGGFLIFKWNDTDIKVSEILKLTPEKPVFGHISGKRSNTHWICFMKE